MDSGFITRPAEWRTYHLKGDMDDFKTVVKSLSSFLKKSVVRVACWHYQMRGQGDLRGAHGPDVKIVNFTNTEE